MDNKFFSRIKDITSFDSKFKDNSWRSRTSGNLKSESPKIVTRLESRYHWSCSQHRPSLITLSRLKLPAHSDPMKRWNFRKANWKRIAFWQVNPQRDCRLRTQQTWGKHTNNFLKACYLRPNNASHVAVARTTFALKRLRPPA